MLLVSFHTTLKPKKQVWYGKRLVTWYCLIVFGKHFLNCFNLAI